jgi:hypothetical protein
MNPEQKRMADLTQLAEWRKWGPYLSERQWGTVREDYSSGGTNVWGDFPFEMAHQRAYRWGEDGIGGFSDQKQELCMSVALWNGKDDLLKERLFGLTGPQGNHAEDVKEFYTYEDGLPSHAYMRMLYKYPTHAFPYRDLLLENQRRGKTDQEYELWDTGIFDEGYLDVEIECAKAGPEDLIYRVTATNCGEESAEIHLLPQLWFRNTWSWDEGPKPLIEGNGPGRLVLHYADGREMFAESEQTECWFTENETNPVCFGAPAEEYRKDAFHRRLIQKEETATHPAERGTKAAFIQASTLLPGESTQVTVRLSSAHQPEALSDSAEILKTRKAECDAFYQDLQQDVALEDHRHIQRMAYAGMLWTKQTYIYDVSQWKKGDPAFPPPPPDRHRNQKWMHLYNHDVISMPDKWEYPWYAAWDSAFHCVPLAEIDPDFAKQQLLLFVEERYQHPNGQIPAYEWKFSDVNPPVHAWGTWEVYARERDLYGREDKTFLSKVFQKLLLNFTWWVNRKDGNDNNVFEGGFLGLDNIGVFDRSHDVPDGGLLYQADGTGWMAMYCLNMFRIAVELATPGDAYEDMAAKFFEHFLRIAGAMHHMGGQGIDLWDDEDDFYHDVLQTDGQDPVRLGLRSMVGLVPLFAVEVLKHERLQDLPGLAQAMADLKDREPELAALVSRWEEPGERERHLLSIARAHRMNSVLRRMLDPEEFLGDHGIRSMSARYRDPPFQIQIGDRLHQVRYTPGESDTYMFGGNSNWRGPIWFPVNYMLITALRRFHRFYGKDYRVESPVGSGNYLPLSNIADTLSDRLISLFANDDQGRRPIWGNHPVLTREDFRDHLLFYEYFNGDNGQGHGAKHQTGWTGLVASLIRERG